MSKNRNLKYQFLNCIERSFKEGMDKHSLKKQGKDNSRVFSYSDRKNLIDLSSNFANWMKENHKEVKLIKEIKAEHVQEFMASKTNSWSSATYITVSSNFRKLETLANNTYQISVDFHSIVLPTSEKNGGAKLRTDMLSQENYNKLLNNSTNQNFKNALLLSRYFGLRASECSKLQYADITKKGISVIDSKGGRSRFVKAESQQQQNIIKGFLNKQGRVCTCKTSSLQQAFNREKKKNRISSASDFHSSRKTFATEKYQEYRKQGLSVQKSLDRVSNSLGHNNNRNDLMKEYICCPIV